MALVSSSFLQVFSNQDVPVDFFVFVFVVFYIFVFVFVFVYFILMNLFQSGRPRFSGKRLGWRHIARESSLSAKETWLKVLWLRSFFVFVFVLVFVIIFAMAEDSLIFFFFVFVLIFAFVFGKPDGILDILDNPNFFSGNISPHGSKYGQRLGGGLCWYKGVFKKQRKPETFFKLFNLLL